MHPHSWRMRCLAVMMLILAVAMAGIVPESAPARPDRKKPTYLSTSECSFCHTEPFGNSQDVVLLTEFHTWRVKDKHSQAFAVLVGPRGKQIGKNLGIDVTTAEAGCLGCHTIDTRRRGVKETQLEKVLLADGVGCEACHGPSSEWLGIHTNIGWREKSSRDKGEFGMNDLRNPRIQARICMSCHVGSVEEGKVITHPMYAAGHPPLPSIEVAQFGENMPRHWYHLRDVPWLKTGASAAQRKNYGYDKAEFRQTRLALTGAVTAMRTSAKLMLARSTPTVEFSATRWPELANVDRANWKEKGAQILAASWPELTMTHFDCAACHHDLRLPSWRQARGYKGKPGRPTPPEWLRTLLPMAVSATESKAEPSLNGVLGEFDRACVAVPFGKISAVVEATPKVAMWCDDMLDSLDTAKIDRKMATSLLFSLCDSVDDRYRDYDTSRQIVSLVDVIYHDLGQPSTKEVAPVLAELKRGLNLTPDPAHDAREALVRAIVLRISKASAKGGKDDYKKHLGSATASKGLSLALTRPPDLTKLSEINDRGLGERAAHFSAYNPKEVQAGLRKVRTALAAKK
jgi:Cytochrome c554 and c-prime